MKRIVSCSDGTWNRPGILDNGKPVKSNVELIYNAIASQDSNGMRQAKFYECGVGSSTFDPIDKIFGGIKGLGIDTKIKDIYTFLVLNYDVGDEIYLFGFSRGAYIARSVAGFIRNCGILKPQNIHLVDMAYKLYRDRNDYSTPDSDFMRSFREKYCDENITPIKFIGVWDTVGSLGLPLRTLKMFNQEKYKFHDVKLSRYVENAYHAVAIDERRILFEPTLWEISPDVQNQQVEQRWFTGVHCNIGGGYADTGLSDLALNWLVEKAKGCGLAVDSLEKLNNENYTFKPNAGGELRNSLTPMYWLKGPKWRDVAVNERIVNGKNIKTNETIDASVKLRYYDNKSAYKPKNLKSFQAYLDGLED
jgi:uncharacterized protein (DUF2235 family)